MVLVMRIVLIIALGTLALGACGGADDGAAEAELRIVATTTILGDVVAAVAGPDAVVTVLISPGADPHDFQPSARQAGAIRDADLVVANGLGLEQAFDRLLDAADEQGTLLAVAPELDPLPVAEPGHDGLDPHVWLDPIRMADAALLIGDALADVAPDIEWPERAELYAQQLEALHADIEAQVASIPAERKVLVTNHDVLGYFAARYGFDVVGVIIPGGGTAAEPSAQDIEQLADKIEHVGVPAIFGETTHPGRLAETLRDEVGAEIEVVELYTESLGEPGSGATTYIEMMRTNVTRIVDALVA
jgi:zinc/manganese transport system substrate-binding protein